MSSSDSASATESSGHSGKVSKRLLLENAESDEDEREAKTELQSLRCPTEPRATAVSALFSLNCDTFLFTFHGREESGN